MRKNKILYYFICIISLCSSCKLYKFSDASIDPNIKSFSVNQVKNIAVLQNINLAPTFTDKLKEKFLRDTRMALTRENGNMDFTCTITEYTVEPVSIINNTTTAQNKLYIAIKVDCKNNNDDKKSFSQTFREGEPYDANKQLNDVEDNLMRLITDRIVQQIFTKSFVNW